MSADGSAGCGFQPASAKVYFSIQQLVAFGLCLMTLPSTIKQQNDSHLHNPDIMVVSVQVEFALQKHTYAHCSSWSIGHQRLLASVLCPGQSSPAPASCGRSSSVGFQVPTPGVAGPLLVGFQVPTPGVAGPLLVGFQVPTPGVAGPLLVGFQVTDARRCFSASLLSFSLVGFTSGPVW